MAVAIRGAFIHTNKRDEHSCGRGEEECPPPKTIDNEECHKTGGYQRPYREDGVDQSLDRLRGVADGVEDQRQIILEPSLAF